MSGFMPRKLFNQSRSDLDLLGLVARLKDERAGTQSKNQRRVSLVKKEIGIKNECFYCVIFRLGV